MNASSRPIRLLLLETDRSVSAQVQNLLQTRALRKELDLTAVATLVDLFHEVDKAGADAVLLDLDPRDAADFVPLQRLRAQAPEIPVIALLPDGSESRALEALEAGADDYLLEAQVNPATLAPFLRRTMKRRAAERAVRESEERFRLMIENASDVILVLDRNGTVDYAGPSTERILGVPPADLVERNALDFLHRDDRRRFLDPFEKAFGESGALPFVQFRFRRPDGGWVHLEGKGRVVNEASGRRVCILNSHDVSHRVKLEEELRSLSLRDELTGLHNRRAFVTFFDQQVKMAHRSESKSIHLLFIDLDGFKGINDTHGHKEGDRALIEASRILRTTFRDADIVARLGGDEFVVFLTDDVQTSHVEGLKKRLTDSVEEWNRREARAYQLAMSVGVVHHDLTEKRSTEDLLFQADELMYRQKREKKAARGQAPLLERDPARALAQPPIGSSQN